MARTVVALAVLALLSVAQAERSLSAHKASGGSSLHAIGISDVNYYTTNGNGTWASNWNRAYASKSACYGSAITNQGDMSYFFKQGAAISDVSFPSRLLGVAVGIGCTGNSVWTDTDFNVPSSSAAVTGTTSIRYSPNILTTYDQGATWQSVTGFSTTPKSFAQTFQYASSTSVTQAGTQTRPAPDLMSVHCTTRSLCFAAGGYFGTIVGMGYAITASPSFSDQVQSAISAVGVGSVFPAINPNVLPVAGAILRSTNGGSYWSYVSLPPAIAITSSAASQPLPGLTDISTDSSGRHVYAVGAPFFAGDYVSGAANGEPTSSGTATAGKISVAGTIIYSGSYGVSNSWVVQTAPIISGYWYSLNAVTVLRGTTAITVGGSPFGLNSDLFTAATGAIPALPAGGSTAFTQAALAPAKPSGVLLMTVNGGFSWLQQNLPSWSFYTGSTTNNYVTALNNSAFLPALNDVACYNAVVNSASYYNCIAVGEKGYVVKASIPALTISNSVTTSVSSWSWVNITQVALNTGYLDLYGITWDNSQVGYMFGSQTILATHNGGLTWVSETPNQIVSSSLTAATEIYSLATVPTTY